MKFTLPIAALAAVSTAAPLEERQSSGGTGPYAPATYMQDPSLTRHTIYKPSSKADTTKLPVMLWGNGGCSADATGQAPFLLQLASHGVLIIASGTPKGSGQTTSAMMKESINWITKQAGKGSYANVDASRIVASGWSCGGFEAYEQIWDDRVSSLGIWSSGDRNKTGPANFKKPVFFFAGGPSDGASGGAERDYKAMPAGIPKWKGQLPVGHGGTYTERNGGKFGIIGAKWVQWIMRGNTTASEYLTGSGAKSAGWTVESASLENLKITPI
ncbi:hypothetical protein DM02DRAFT_577208, partial [Periconia macrospinosa]